MTTKATTTKAWVATLGCALMFGCASHGPSLSGSPSDPPSANGDDGSAGSGGGSDDASSGGGGNGSSSGGGTTPVVTTGPDSGSSSSGGMAPPSAGPPDAGTIPDSDIGQTVTLAVQPFMVAPGAEVYMCQLFANPFTSEADLVWMQGTQGVGSHHFFLFSMDPFTTLSANYSTTLAPCPNAGLEFHPFPYLSQQPEWTVQYPPAPDGSPMGYPLQATNHLMMNVHYLNTGSSPIMATASIIIKAAKPGIVKTHVGTLFLSQQNMSIPPTATVSNPVNSASSWGGNPNAASSDGSYSIFNSWSHMHKWGLDLSASTNNQTYYSETNWNEPALFWHMAGYRNPSTATGNSTPVKMTTNQSISWSCKYFNDTGKTLTFGESAQTNVMCIYVANYYPANATNPDVLISN
jgi:hypothetical protein